jgi:inorganic triphosphatase YgiF
MAQGTALEPLLSGKLRRTLGPVFETRVRRTIHPLARKDFAVDLTVDKGSVDTGRDSLPLCEVELELKRGDRSQMFDVARTLMEAVPAQLTLKSKAERGYDLVAGTVVSPVKAEPVHLAPGMSTGEAFRIVAYSCLRHLLANEPAMLHGDAEGLHQMRVALRRLRAAISLFSDILDGEQAEMVKAGLKWITSQLGPARELDVFLASVVDPACKERAPPYGVPEIEGDLARKCREAHAHAEDAVRSSRFRILILDTAAWIDGGEWSDDDLARARGGRRIELSAAEQLQRRCDMIRKKGKRLSELDARSRHKLRIQAKKVRYACEFFADLFPGKKAAKRRAAFLGALRDLQDRLGELNDIEVHEGLTLDLAKKDERGREGGRRRAFAAGLLSGREDARLASVLEGANAAYEAFARIKPFWT